VERCDKSRQATDNNIIGRMRIACQITKATDTHSEYVILIAFPRQQMLRERPSVSRLYVHCLSCKNDVTAGGDTAYLYIHNINYTVTLSDVFRGVPHFLPICARIIP
jgi:hypothetical protein